MKTTKRQVDESRRGRGREFVRRSLAIATAFLATIVLARFCSPDPFDAAALVLGEGPIRTGAVAQDEFATEQADADGESSPARRLLVESIARLEETRSLSAEFDFESHLFGERYFGRGRYEEASATAATTTENSPRRRPLDQTRFRLRASTGKTSVKEALEKTEENVLEVVCDADRQALWTYSSVEGAKSLSHINIEELSNVLARLDDNEQIALQANGVDKPCGANGLPGLGGLAGTLKHLGAIYRFAPQIETTASTLGGIPVVKISGTMKTERIERLKAQLGVEAFEPYLAENIPTGVEIYFGKDWPFPYKIQYFSISEDEKHARNDVFFVEYSSVVRNDATIRPENFNYNQPQINFERKTAAYLERLIPGVRL